MNDTLSKLAAKTAQGKFSRRAFMGRAAALGVTVTMASGLLASAVRAEAKKGGMLNMGLGGGGTTDTLDPALAANNVTFSVNRQWGDAIVNVTATGEIEPRLAESFESSPDAKVWTFKIRPNVKYHDGTVMTPEDVVATFKRHSDENSKSGALAIMQGIESMAVDGDKVVLTLSTANADLPFLVSDYHLVIQPGGGVAAPDAGVGTGPYKVVTSEPGVRYEFEKFADHWDPAVGHFDGVEMLVINDGTARSSALQSGQVAMINKVEPKVAGLLGRAPGVTVENVSGRGHYVFIMRCDVAPFDNNDLRLALKYAIDRQEMVDKILNGYGSIGNDIPINAAYPLFDDTLPQREFSIEKAAEHYKLSGHDGSPIVLKVADTAFPGAVDAAALFQQSAAKAGIPLEIQRVPDDGYWSEVWNKEPFSASYWGGRPVQDQMYSTAYMSTADWNDTAFRNPDFDAMILSARGELDPVKRKAIYSEMAKLLHETGGVICPMFNDFIDAVNDTVVGFEADPNYEMMGGFASSKCSMA